MTGRTRFAAFAGLALAAGHGLAAFLEHAGLPPELALVVLLAAVPPTVARLRALGLPAWPALLVLVPALGLVLYVVLLILSQRPAQPPRIVRIVPETRIGSAVAAIVVTAVLSAAFVAIAASGLRIYGWALFVAAPFTQGLVAALVHGMAALRSVSDAIGVALIALCLSAATVVCVALEGLICIVMALPILAPAAVLGALVGYLLQRRSRRATGAMCAAVLVLPVLAGIERMEQRDPAILAVTTSVIVDAPPAVVWRNVVSVEPLPAPRELLFRAGVAYPTEAVISGSGVGAVRRCRFSTGDFVEPITAWEPGRRLAFDVAAQPQPMRELSPWDIHPPHLDGFLHSKRGEFRLLQLPGGRTLLRGTTWYENRMWPARYWQVWSDETIHRIHLRVLRHIAHVAEAAEESPAF